MKRKFLPVISTLILALLAAIGLKPAMAKKASPSASRLAEALQKEDPALIREAVTAAREELGDQAGLPEVPDKFVPIPKDARMLTRDEAQLGFSRDFPQLEKLIWWKVGMDPSTITAPLRAPASVISGSAAVVRGKLDGAERSLTLAKQAADFLIWAQDQAGAGVFPFPAARGTSEAAAMQAATRFLDRAEKAGKLDTVVRNGWAFEDLSDGGLQFDNGECGVAMFELFEVTKDARYLDSARRAADWALSRPLCPNWNYNSFSVYLLAKAFAVTREQKYLDVAIRKARLGVIPGQLTDGHRAGRWLDPHNAQPTYHYIMLRALAQLAAVMPPDHGDRPEIRRALALGLKSRNAEIVTQGVMNKDKAMEALLLVSQVFHDDAAFLNDTLTRVALQVMLLFISAEARGGNVPLSPREWGHSLERIAGMSVAH